MDQLGEQQPGRLAQAAEQVLSSGRRVIRAITPTKRDGGLTSGFPNTQLSPGQANFGQTSGLPSVSKGFCSRCSQLLHAWEGTG